MIPTQSLGLSSRTPLVALAAVWTSVATAQVPGVSREQMWPAPTAEDWELPCLITWQRTYEDALAVSKETGEPILVCVNMDGEIASEHYAGVRYRQPEIAALYEPYVCVIASTYRHTPLDHDEKGERILCPRFGSVTCGEHIAIEPGLFEQFFEGQRVAPRHIGVELDSAEMYDVFYAFDTDTIFDALREGVAGREALPPMARSDRPLLERVSSRHTDDQSAVEKAYVAGDRELRRQLLQSVLDGGAGGAVTQVGLLRLAVFGLDVELAGMAREALARTSEPAATDLITEALRVPMDPAEREALIGALERIGADFPRARTMAVAHRGLASDSQVIDAASWLAALAGAEPAARDASSVAARLENGADALSIYPNDAAVHLEVARASLDLAAAPGTDPKYSRLLVEDGLRSALEAERLGAKGWLLDAVIARASMQLDDSREAYARAQAAVGGLVVGDVSAESHAVLKLFAQSRQRSIGRAVWRKEEWSAEWIADVHAAYSVLARHPLGTDAEVAMHYDFLKWFGAARVDEILVQGLARHPESWILHDRLRGRLLREGGVAGLEAGYEAMLGEVNASPNLEWFAGYASIVAAEFLRRQGEDTGAAAAYDRAVAHYERAIENNPAARDTADHYVVLALAGGARLALERGELDLALAELLSAFERRVDSVATLDGLGISPVGTAKMLLARLESEGHGEQAEILTAALDELDPSLLELPEFERGGRPSPDAQRFGRRNR